MEPPLQPKKNVYRLYKPHARPFWQADKPYLHDCGITDGRFRALGYIMSFLAGAINAGGFFAVQRYTSHVTGAMSGAADALFLGDWEGALVPVAVVTAFLLGAAHSNWTILWAKRHRFRSGYGLSMWLESLYLLVFGLLGVALSHYGKILVPPTVLLLCFIMGMHNTVLTVLSGSVIRSTHMTGTVTDLGIELSKVLYYRRSDNPRLPDVSVNKPKMRLLLTLLASFSCGGLVGAWGYHRLGYHFTLPVSALLFLFGIGSVGYDVRLRWRIYWRHKKQLSGKGGVISS
ncbi:Predicted membrane protein [Kingella potus]|uniref:Predicted membrane protein n=1 Tax=Kingella potus TaxID=265175 RepID=A0A377R0Y7_9NEIS|nr:YoaK family protein [Kingella potus]STR00759.1 Predicted membrane protein [Kingella potus]